VFQQANCMDLRNRSRPWEAFGLTALKADSPLRDSAGMGAGLEKARPHRHRASPGSGGLSLPQWQPAPFCLPGHRALFRSTSGGPSPWRGTSTSL